MTRAWTVLPVAACLLAAGCTSNSAPGNDREAALDTPAPAAEIAGAAAAIEGVATGLLHPQIMTDAEVASVPVTGERCTFRMTRVGMPVLVHGSSAVVKLNDRLVVLPAAGKGRYAADGVTVTVRPLDDVPSDGEAFEAEFVLHLPGASSELGFHGYSQC